ncbi:MAG: hypothetical protein AB2L24_00620 [Mangrovibacterium sp.]
MKKYSLILSPHIPSATRIEVWELCKNDKSIFQSFIDEIENDEYLFDKLAGAIGIIENSANLIRLPKNKFRLIEGHQLRCKIYEAKSDIIRIYMFHEEKTGRIIVTGGKKNNQKKT